MPKNFDVPQYIDVEDKIAFQLTAKQLGWFALAGVLMFFAWTFSSKQLFIFWSIVIVLVSLAMAFLKPYGITLASFMTYGILHTFRPKQYIWQRAVHVDPADFNPMKVAKKEDSGKKKQSLDQVDKLANVLDNRRTVR